MVGETVIIEVQGSQEWPGKVSRTSQEGGSEELGEFKSLGYSPFANMMKIFLKMKE